MCYTTFLSFLVLFIAFHSIAATSVKLRVITWNVADNSRMKGGFTDEAIDKVLGVNEGNYKKFPSVYAIGLQENCWMCDKKNWGKIGARFLRRINRKALNSYTVVGMQGTRVSATCEITCRRIGNHGTVLLIVIAKRSLGQKHLPFRHNAGCSANLFPNKEKGVSAIRYIMKQKSEKKKDKSVCFGAAHLDSAKPSYKRSCLKGFFDTADKEVDWTKSCDFQFIFGDFNTRTGDKTKDKGAEYVPITTNFVSLKTKDELTGSDPYGADPNLKKNLLTYLNTVQEGKFKEGLVDFMPTYSVKPANVCSGNFPCYRKDRPKSWTDRIIFTKGKNVRYEALYEDYGDHFPVFAEFTLNM